MAVASGKPRTLYVRRPLLNTREFLAWAILQGFDETLKADDLHVTIAYSKKAVEWAAFKPRVINATVPGGLRSVEPLGDQGAVCLIFQGDELAERHRTFEDGGASWDWPQYRPHVTITYQGGAVDLSRVMPFEGPLEFGPEVFEEVDEDWADKVKGAQDSMALDRSSVRRIDQDGHLHVERTPISKATVNPYYGREIPGYEALGLDADRIYQLYRDPEELAKGASTFAGKPLLHIHKPVNARDHPKEAVVGSIGSEVDFDDPYLMAPLSVWVGEAIDLIDSDEQREISCGYQYDPDMTPGTVNGMSYDGVMRNIRGNHVALVTEGRAGPDVLVQDAALKPQDKAGRAGEAPPKGSKMTKTTARRGAEDAKAKDEATTEANSAMPAAGKARDKAKDKAHDEEPDRKEKLRSFLKDKLSEDDMKACDEMMDDDGAEDEASEKDEAEDEKDDERKDGAEDEETEKVDKKAMDAAIRAAAVATTKTVTQAVTQSVRETERAIRKAERDVHPFVGELAMTFDSAEEVYRHSLELLGVAEAKTIHASALPTILAMQKKPGAQPVHLDNRISMDAASISKAHEIAPGLSRIKIGA